MSELAVPDRALWERQRGESGQAYAAFLHYRDQQPPRTVRKAAERIAADGPRKVESVYTQLRGWASPSKWGWEARADEFDRMLDRRYIERIETEADRAHRAEMALAASMTRIGLQRLNGDERAGVRRVDPNDLEAKDLPAFVLAGVRIGQRARGEPTDIVRSVTTISLAEHEQEVLGVAQILIQFIPPERRDGALDEVRRYGASRR